MSLLLRMVLIGLVPLGLSAVGILTGAGWGLIAALAGFGVCVSAWMYHRWVITLLTVSLQSQARLEAEAQDLKSSHEQLYQVFHTSPDWIVIAELDSGMIVEANEGFERISGYARSDVIGRSAKHLRMWPDPAQRDALVDQMKQEGGARNVLVQLRRRDGTVIDSRVSAALITLQGRANSHVVWIARDVTQEHATNAQFAAAFQLTPDFISISRVSDGRYVQVNDAFERITGFSREEVIGRTSVELGIWHRADQRQDVMKAFDSAPFVRDVVVEIGTRQGEVRHGLVNGAVYEARGERYLIAIVRDVTEARLAEKALRESEEKFSKLFEQSPLPMVHASAVDGKIIYQRNEAWHTAFGYTPEVSRGKSAVELGMWADPEVDNTLRQLALVEDASGALRDESPLNDWEVEVICADGSRRWVSVFWRFIQGDGQTMRVTTLIDITERRRIRQELLLLNAELESRVAERTRQLEGANTELSQTLQILNDAKDHLVHSEKLAALGALVAGISHEINTPVGVSYTAATYLEDKLKSLVTRYQSGALSREDLANFISAATESTSMVLANLRQAAELIRNFKMVAVDQASAKRRGFMLKETIEEILSSLHHLVRETDVRIELHLAEGIRMDSYPGPLGQVLINLVKNALLHAFEGRTTGVIRIETTHVQNERSLKLTFADNGVGIPAQSLGKIFDPFFTTKFGNGGSGLGLNIAHNIVTGVLGGSIEASSQPGKGTEFLLRLPLMAPEVVSSQ
jgi:PAS domain S-box-containing protein